MIRGAGLATLAYLSLALVACRGDGRTGPGTVVPPDGTDFTCPGEGVTICDLKYEDSAEHPAVSDPVAMVSLLVTTPVMTVSSTPEGMVTLSGFYAQDQETLQGEYAGILVVFGPELAASAPMVGDIVDINGTFEMFGREGAEQQKQIKAASITVTNRGTVMPLDVSSPSVVLEKAKAYEGVLLKLPEVAITNNMVQHNGSDIFYAFEIENTLVVSGSMFRYSNPQIGEVFSSITGVLRVGTAPFDAGLYQLTPRFQLDVVPKNAAAVVTTIRDIQDVTSPGHPVEGCRNTSGTTEGKCAVARLTDVVVTAVNGYVSRNLRSMFVTDTTVQGGRFAGVKVVYNPNSINLLPEVGMHIDIEGEIIEYRRGTQIQYATISVNNPTMTTVEPIVVSADDIDRASAPEMNPWEGQLVRIENAEVTTACLEDDQQRDHGNFVLNGKVYVGSGFDYAYNGDLRPSGTMCLDSDMNPTGLCACSMPPPNDQRMVGDTFTSVTGVMDYAFDELQLQPRSDADLVR